MVLKDYLINNNNFMLNKEEVLKNLDKVKEWNSECDSKKETVKKKLQIKNRFTGEIIYESEKTTNKEVLEEAVKEGADLKGKTI